eukprot:TRINITY_DN2650_c0_g1_i1.p1 TRINITY_DN2650_c0_g1~~TRINITY_DN2650_c0_g1_i1.p1  ORF type:complete len:247 (-),score=6.10 TRINITY_DN2650_c0_g1_i1:95-835(-)
MAVRTSPRHLREAKAASREYWSTYGNMRGMAAANPLATPRNPAPLPEPHNPNVTKPQAPAFTLSGRHGTHAEETPGPGAYSPKPLASKISPRFAPSSKIELRRHIDPGPGAYDPKLPTAPAPRFAGRLPDPTDPSQGLAFKRMPGPADYTLPSDFNPSNKGFSFGLRTKVEPPAIRQNMPGPGSYEQRSTLAGLKFSLGSRVVPVFSDDAPGPGTYDVLGHIESQTGKGGITLKGREALDSRRYPD